jgi:PKD repeat protein
MDIRNLLSKKVLILLIALVIVLVVVITFTSFYGMVAPKPPTFTPKVETSGKVVYIYHDGGDTLSREGTRVIVNDQVVPITALTFLNGQDWPWTPGKTLKAEYTGPGLPTTLEVQVTSGGKDLKIYSTLLREPEKGGIPVITMTPAPILTTLSPTLQVTQVEGTTPYPGTKVVTPVAPVTTSPTRSLAGPPLADFTANPLSGPTPLTIWFSDRSIGVAQTWFWSFGDGETSTQPNPVHTYSRGGRYTVSLTVSNQYGVNTKTTPGLIMVGLTPQTSFSASVRNGTAPLMVQFTDTSTGGPMGWLWDFGDNTSATQQNPLHLYPSPGTYQVALSTWNQFGGDMLALAEYITVAPIALTDIYLYDGKWGNLSPDGYISFRVTGPGSWIKIGGTQRTFEPGDIVQLFIGSTTKFQVDIEDGMVLIFASDPVRMFVNGRLIATGSVSGIKVYSTDSMRSTLVLNIPPEDTFAQLMVNNRRVVERQGQGLLFTNFRMDSDGDFDLTVSEGYIYVKAGVERYEEV